MELTDAEKEYRAQWIRDAARDLMVAAARAGAYAGADEYERRARCLWDLYVKERE